MKKILALLLLLAMALSLAACGGSSTGTIRPNTATEDHVYAPSSDSNPPVESRDDTGKFEAEMRELAEKNDYATMRVVYAEAQQNPYCVISDQMTQLFADQELQFRRDIIDRSIQAYRDGGYEAAIPAVAEGLAVLPEDEVFLDFEAKYKGCTPVSFFELKRLNGNYSKEGSVSDIYGNDYKESAYWYVSEYGNTYLSQSVEVQLERKYSTLQAVCVPKIGENREVHVSIYVDEVLVFDETFKQKTEPIPVNIPVKNANFLKIEVEFSGRVYDYQYFYLAEPILTRELSEADLRNPLK